MYMYTSDLLEEARRCKGSIFLYLLTDTLGDDHYVLLDKVYLKDFLANNTAFTWSTVFDYYYKDGNLYIKADEL